MKEWTGKVTVLFHLLQTLLYLLVLRIRFISSLHRQENNLKSTTMKGVDGLGLRRI